MQTAIHHTLKNRDDMQEADAILRSCVHCGFCTATCPTYQLLGNELDGPRGRIYLIKELLESGEANSNTRDHLDRCLTCRACETTCPSGVRFARLIHIGRRIVADHVLRPWKTQFLHRLILNLLPDPERFGPALAVARIARPLLPGPLKKHIPRTQKPGMRPHSQHQRQMLILEGCVQSKATPNTNSATARVLDTLGISLISPEQAGCCGAINHHLEGCETARDYMRNNIDTWWPYIEQGVEAIIVTASACGLMVKEYGEALQDDPDYADKARYVSELAKDICEVVAELDLERFANKGKGIKVAYHASCTLQHGQRLSGVVETILQDCGYTLLQVRDSHLCCGAAGSYMLLQPKLSQRLLEKKLDTLSIEQPDVIATSNIGCQLHLQSKIEIPVKHWIELLDSPS